MSRLMFFALMMVLHVCPLCHSEDRLELLAGGLVKEVGIQAVDAKLNEPFAAEFDEKDQLWVVEMARGNRLLRVDRDGKLMHVAGKMGTRREGEEETLVDGRAMEATFHGPHNLAIFSHEEIFVGDTWNGRVRVWMERTDYVACMANYAVDKDKARQEGPYCITFSPDKKTLYIANLQQVFARDMYSGEIRVVAGNGKKGVPVDGARAAESPLVDPRAVTVDKDGYVYILERNGHALRVVDPAGVIQTVVNRHGKKGNGLEEGAAVDIGLNGPKHLCMDVDGCVIIADAESHTIRRYCPKKRTITRLAGTGKAGKGDLSLPPRECMLNRPHGVSIQPSTGQLVITDSYNDRVLLLRHE